MNLDNDSIISIMNIMQQTRDRNEIKKSIVFDRKDIWIDIEETSTRYFYAGLISSRYPSEYICF